MHSSHSLINALFQTFYGTLIHTKMKIYEQVLLTNEMDKGQRDNGGITDFNLGRELQKDHKNIITLADTHMVSILFAYYTLILCHRHAIKHQESEIYECRPWYCGESRQEDRIKINLIRSEIFGKIPALLLITYDFCGFLWDLLGIQVTQKKYIPVYSLIVLLQPPPVGQQKSPANEAHCLPCLGDLRMQSMSSYIYLNNFAS